MDNKTVLSDSYFKDAIPRREQWPTPGQIREYEQSYGIKYEPMSLPTEQHSKPEPEMKPERTKEEILTELIRAINPKWDYGKDDEEVFRSFWYFFNPEPARTIILKAMEEYRQSSPVEPANALIDTVKASQDAVKKAKQLATEQSGGEQKGEYSIADLMVDAERQFYLLQTITTPAPPKDKDEFVKGFMEGSFFCSSLRERQLQEQVTALNLELGTLRVENVQKDDLIKELQDQKSEQSGEMKLKLSLNEDKTRWETVPDDVSALKIIPTKESEQSGGKEQEEMEDRIEVQFSMNLPTFERLMQAIKTDPEIWVEVKDELERLVNDHTKP